MFGSPRQLPPDSAIHEHTAHPYVHMVPNGSDAERSRFDALAIVAALHTGMLPGCGLVGGIEDGTAIAYCPDYPQGAQYQGANVDGTPFMPYSGPLSNRVIERSACYTAGEDVSPFD
jgi:hypothetical protein